MAEIKGMIERIIALHDQGIHLTLLGICPNSEAVLEASIRAAARNHAPMLFPATLNQVDRDGGYTGWTPPQLIEKIRFYAEKYQCHPMLYPCLDHGGQWLKDGQKSLSFEETTAWIKESITADLAVGYRLLHIDPTVDPSGSITIDQIVDRSLDLIAYSESERTRLDLPPIDYEVGTEEVHGGLVDLANFAMFMEHLKERLAAQNLPFPAFVVAQVGTDLHTEFFDSLIGVELYQIAVPYGALIKGHYTDWVSNPGDYPLARMGGANVGPEFTAHEYAALAALECREQDLCRADLTIKPAHFTAALTQAIENSNRWQKWLLPKENATCLADLTPHRREWMIKSCARYVWTVPSVQSARADLYHNLTPIMGDPHEYVVEWITATIERYILAFHLFGAVRYF